MKKLNVDLGIKEYELGSGVLRFNPADPNVYNRFYEVRKRLEALDAEYAAAIQKTDDTTPDGVEDDVERGGRHLALMSRYDAQIKAELDYVFGPGNHFDALLDGVNLLAVTENGERVLTNLFAAITPLLEDGMQRHTKDSAETAIKVAKANRAARRAAAHHTGQ